MSTSCSNPQGHYFHADGFGCLYCHAPHEEAGLEIKHHDANGQVLSGCAVRAAIQDGRANGILENPPGTVVPKLIYLATPCTHDNPDVEEFRFDQACIIAAKLFALEVMVFSPIVHNHPVIEIGSRFCAGGSWHKWANFDRLMITRCDEVWVAMIDGWHASVGVLAEVSFAQELGKPVYYLHPDVPVMNGRPVISTT